MLTRRNFVRMMGIWGGVALAPLGGLVRRMSSSFADTEPPPAGELYAGFVLLPRNAPIPSFVQCAPAPILCQVSGDERDPVVMAHRAETSWFDSVEGLTGNISLPIYVPALLPAGMVFINGCIISFAQSGRVFEARMDFGLPDSHQPLVSVWARPMFPQPYPVWSVDAPPFYESQARPEQDEITISPEKVSFTPVQGLMLPTAQGHLLHWIRHDILYTLVVEHDQQRSTVEDIAKTLVEI